LKKNILITGASSGICFATAIRFAKTKLYRLIICGRRSDRINLLAEKLHSEYETEVSQLSFDVRNYEECAKAIASLKHPFDKVDILLNNAGLALGLDYIQDGNLEHWNTMIDTNVKGLLHMTQLISKGMIERQNGHIINICSTAGKEVYPKGNVYCASKFAVEALTKGIRQDLVTHGIRVGQVSPGHVEETEFAINRFEGDQQKADIYKDFTPLNASDVADAIFYMANCPPHVNIQDILMTGTQQASASLVDRSGRKYKDQK